MLYGMVWWAYHGIWPGGHGVVYIYMTLSGGHSIVYSYFMVVW